MGTTSFGLPTSGAGQSTNGGNFLGDTLKFETFHGGNILKKIGNDPSRLITGVDPASTWMWNKVLGTHNKPIVDQMGGATGDDYAKANQKGINTTAGHDTQDLAHVIAAAFAAEGLAGAGGMGGGSMGSTADPALAGDSIDAGGGWSAGSDPALLGDNIDAGGGWSAGGDPALAGDNIDAGGGWNPSTGSSSNSSQSSGMSAQQRQMIAKMLQNAGNSRSGQTQSNTYAMQRGQQWNPGGGTGFVSPT